MATQVVLQRINSKACLIISSIILALCAWTANPAFAARDKVHIAAFGDSLTAGYGLPPGADFASRLEAALVQAQSMISCSVGCGVRCSAGITRSVRSKTF